VVGDLCRIIELAANAPRVANDPISKGDCAQKGSPVDSKVTKLPENHTHGADHPLHRNRLLVSFRGAMTFASDRRAPTCPWGKCDTINPIMPSWFYWGGKAVGPRMTNGFVIGDSR